jgi:hypothetical protein
MVRGLGIRGEEAKRGFLEPQILADVFDGVFAGSEQQVAVVSR